jgi:cytoskeletal protein CcmA (bactofilin family)
MANRKQGVGKDALNTIVGKQTVLEGCFEVHDGIRVDGTLKGQLTSSGTLVVGPSGQVKADPIRVKDAVIAGRLEGKLEASHQVKLEAGAVLIGDITAQVLIVEEGSIFRGFCDAGQTVDVDLPTGKVDGEPVEAKQATG